MTILRLVVRYRKVETIERGIAVTPEVLRATSNLARARGAVPLILVPQFVPEETAERALRQRILDGADLHACRWSSMGTGGFPATATPTRAPRARWRPLSPPGYERVSRTHTADHKGPPHTIRSCGRIVGRTLMVRRRATAARTRGRC